MTDLAQLRTKLAQMQHTIQRALWVYQKNRRLRLRHGRRLAALVLQRSECLKLIARMTMAKESYETKTR